MKKQTLTILFMTLLTQSALARGGDGERGRERDHDHDQDHDNELIVCTDKNTNKTLLQFQSIQGQGQVSTAVYDLQVQARGDDIGAMSITDKRSGDSLRAKHLEESLKVTLKTDENPAQPIVGESATHRGFAEVQVTDPNSGDKAIVKSNSRRRLNQMEVQFVTDENPNASINILCRSDRD